MTDLKQKLFAKWQQNFHWLDNEKFVSSIIDVLCQQRAALEYCANDTGLLHSPVSTAKQALAATDSALKKIGVE